MRFKELYKAKVSTGKNLQQDDISDYLNKKIEISIIT